MTLPATSCVGSSCGSCSQVADAGALGDPGLAGELLVDAGHDLEQRRLARAVDADHADLGVRVEGQLDVLQDLLAAGIGLGQALHVIDELAAVHKNLVKSGKSAPRRGRRAGGAMWGNSLVM